MNVSGVILAGGLGNRMGRVNKGLQKLLERPMIEWVIERFKNQVDELFINANQDQAKYRDYGYRVIEDEIQGFLGPLAGLHSAMKASKKEFVATAPCDSPFLPETLVKQLSKPFQENTETEITVAKNNNRLHPVFCLVKTSKFDDLDRYISNGGRKIDRWFNNLNTVDVEFDSSSNSFLNFNTPDELNDATTIAKKFMSEK